MKWEVIRKVPPEVGDKRYGKRFAWLPTRVLNLTTMTDHMVWFETYGLEQMYCKDPLSGDLFWRTISRTVI